MSKQNRRLPRFIIRFSVGMGDEDHKIISAHDLTSAIDYAYEEACQMYEAYDGMHGNQSVEEIMQEEKICGTDAFQIWRENRENVLEYDAKCISILRGS